MLLPFTEGLVRTTPFDRECAALADRHYSRRTIGASQFTYSGRKLVLRDSLGLVVFVWHWADLALRMDGQAGYCCSLFRNESPHLSSAIILEAEHHAVDVWGPSRMFTYVDPRKVASPNPGYCFLCAGWRRDKTTGKGKILLVKDARILSSQL